MFRNLRRCAPKTASQLRRYRILKINFTDLFWSAVPCFRRKTRSHVTFIYIFHFMNLNYHKLLFSFEMIPYSTGINWLSSCKLSAITVAFESLLFFFLISRETNFTDRNIQWRVGIPNLTILCWRESRKQMDRRLTDMTLVLLFKLTVITISGVCSPPLQWGFRPGDSPYLKRIAG